ncbi:MAG: hypothetical protein J6U74_01350 [Clostridia bacterium]|nr:hypothetical protein [Clostridia bacterium]
MKNASVIKKGKSSKRICNIYARIKDYMLPTTLLIFVGLMLAFPSYYLEGTKKGLAIFSSSVLPAIFPFVFLSTLISKTNIIDKLSKAFSRPVKALFGASPYGAYVLFSALISGYPVGAVTTLELYEKGLISSEEAKSYIPFSSTASPIFILATIGGAMFQSTTIGVIILISHYTATLLNGILWHFIRKKEQRHGRCDDDNSKLSRTCSQACAHTLTCERDNNNENIISDAVVKAVASMLAVGGYIVLFGLVVDTVSLFPFFYNLPNAVKSVLFALIEMSRGVAEARMVGDKWLAIALSAFAVTFGGVSVNLQNYHYLSKCKCTLKQVLLPKFSQGILAFFTAIFFSLIFFNIFGIKC